MEFTGAPRIRLELIDEDRTLVAHADLGALDLAADDVDDRLAALLAANAPQYIEAGAASAIDPVTGSWTLFRRFEFEDHPYEDLAAELRQFAEAARRKLAESPAVVSTTEVVPNIPFEAMRV